MQALLQEQAPRGFKPFRAAVEVFQRGRRIHAEGPLDFFGEPFPVAPSGEAGAVGPEIVARPVQFAVRKRRGLFTRPGQRFSEQFRPGEQAGTEVEPIFAQVELAQFAAHFRGRLEYRHVASGSGRPNGGGESAHARSYDGDGAHLPRWSAARSKQMRNQVVNRSGSADISSRIRAKEA